MALGIKLNVRSKINKNIMIKHFSKILLLVLILIPFITFAIEITNPLGTTDIQGIMKNILNAIFSIVGIIAVAMIVWGGIQLMISGGEEQKREAAKKTITYAIIGLIVVILSSAILEFIMRALRGR